MKTQKEKLADLYKDYKKKLLLLKYLRDAVLIKYEKTLQEKKAERIRASILKNDK